MIYLGTEKESGKRVMFGSSDGRSYNGKARWGVSVFDFKMPREATAEGAGSKADFLGYARIPTLRKGSGASSTGGSADSASTVSNTPAAASDPSATPAGEGAGDTNAESAAAGEASQAKSTKKKKKTTGS
jgi:hypothetical protein